MTFLDLFEQTIVTEFVRREYDAIIRGAGGGEDRTTSYGERILPLRAHNGRHVRVRYQDILGVGLAQFKAPGAAPALWTWKPNLRERFMELVDIDEMHRIDPIEMMQLNSPDPNVIQEAQWQLADRATKMATRNDQRTEWMRWQALQGVMVVPYPNAAPITVNYGIPAGNFPTITTPWTDLVNADPIEDLWAIGAASIPASGIYLLRHHINFKSRRYMARNQKLRAQLSSYGRDTFLPKESDVQELLREGSEIVVTDDGYMTENSVSRFLVQWIGDGKVFSTTPNYTYANQPLGDVKDGWVLVGVPGQEQPAAKQGMQSEWIYNRIGQQTLFRQASARMPVINAPEAIVWGQVY